MFLVGCGLLRLSEVLVGVLGLGVMMVLTVDEGWEGRRLRRYEGRCGGRLDINCHLFVTVI